MLEGLEYRVVRQFAIGIKRVHGISILKKTKQET